MTKKVTRFVAAVAVAAVSTLASAASAQSLGAYPSPVAAPQAAWDDPAKVVRDRLTKLRRFLAQATGKVSQSQAMAFIERNIAPDVDFDLMTKMALGPMDRRISKELRADAKRMLTSNFTERLVVAMGDMRNTHITVGQASLGIRPDEAEVPVLLRSRNQYPMQVRFHFYRKDKKWKMFDAEANGQSAVLFYRTYFRRQLRERMRAERERHFSQQWTDGNRRNPRTRLRPRY